MTAQRGSLFALARQAAMSVPNTDVVKEVSGIHLGASEKEGTVTLTGTNFETTVRASGGAIVEEAGSVVVDAKLFPAIVTRLPEDTVYLETKNNGHLLNIKCGKTEYNINVLPGETYPKLELPFPKSMVKVSGLPALIEQVAFAASTNKNDKPSMRAVSLTLGTTGLKATACNGSQLMQVEGDRACTGNITLLVPASSLNLLARITEKDSVFQMGTTGKSLVLWDGSLMFSARLASGEPLDADRVFSSFAKECAAIASAEDLRREVGTLASFAVETGRLEIRLTEKSIQMQTGLAEPTKEERVIKEARQVLAANWCRCSAEVKALVTKASATPFYQDSEHLLAALSHMNGQLTLDFSKRGDMVIRSENNGCVKYFQNAMSAPRVRVVPAKPTETQPAKKATKKAAEKVKKQAA